MVALVPTLELVRTKSILRAVFGNNSPLAHIKPFYYADLFEHGQSWALTGTPRPKWYDGKSYSKPLSHPKEFVGNTSSNSNGLCHFGYYHSCVLLTAVQISDYTSFWYFQVSTPPQWPAAVCCHYFACLRLSLICRTFPKNQHFHAQIAEYLIHRRSTHNTLKSFFALYYISLFPCRIILFKTTNGDFHRTQQSNYIFIILRSCIHL